MACASGERSRSFLHQEGDNDLQVVLDPVLKFTDHRIELRSLPCSLGNGFDALLIGVVESQADTHDVRYGGEEAYIPFIEMGLLGGVYFEHPPGEAIDRDRDIQQRHYAVFPQ